MSAGRWTEEQEAARQQLVTAVKDWRNAECMQPRDVGSWAADGGQYDDRCIGDSHALDCPIETARGDIIAAHNKVEQLHAG